MARRQHNPSISLFPFLAVLVCTMGALILLLLVTTRQIRHEQRAGHVTTPAPLVVDQVPDPVVETADPIDAEPPLTEPAAVAESAKPNNGIDNADGGAENDDTAADREKIAALDRQIADSKAELQQKRHLIAVLTQETAEDQERLSRLQDETNSAREEVATLQKKVESADPSELIRMTADTQQRRQQLQERTDQAAIALKQKQRDLLMLNEQADAASMRLSEQRSALLNLRQKLQQKQQQQQLAMSNGRRTLIEFSNSTGTTRTPIVIDVSDAGYEFLPTGIRITANDMQGFPTRDNPLLSGILTLHQHRSQGSVTSQPYVLLLVRPDGSLPFYGAQRVLTEAGIHFGYELLEQDREVVVGPADDTEVRIVRNALLESLNRRTRLYSMLRQSGVDSLPANGGSEPDDRRLVVRSDGRVMTADEASRRPLEGKFYAGGEAPPRPLYRPQPTRRDPFHSQGQDSQNPDQAGRAEPPRDDAETVGAAAGNAASPETEFTEWLSGNNARRAAAGSAAPGDPQNPFGPDPNDFNAADSVVADMQRWSAETPRALQPPPDASTANQSTANQSTANQSTANQSTADQSTADQSTASSNAAGRMSGQSAAGQASGAAQTAPDQPDMPMPGMPLAADGVPDSGKPVDLTMIDAELLKLLKAEASERRERSTPVGITVFLDAEHMTIGQQPTIPVTQDTLNNAFSRLLSGISEEVAANRRDPMDPLLPIVKFVVSPGGERLRIPLARELRKIGIPSASVIEISPYITPLDNVGRTTIRDTQIDGDATGAVHAPPPTIQTVSSSVESQPPLPAISSRQDRENGGSVRTGGTIR